MQNSLRFQIISYSNTESTVFKLQTVFTKLIAPLSPADRFQFVYKKREHALYNVSLVLGCVDHNINTRSIWFMNVFRASERKLCTPTHTHTKYGTNVGQLMLLQLHESVHSIVHTHHKVIAANESGIRPSCSPYKNRI